MKSLFSSGTGYTVVCFAQEIEMTYDPPKKNITDLERLWFSLFQLDFFQDGTWKPTIQE